jgi:hypothetical protein
MRIDETAVETANAADLAEQRAELDDGSFDGESGGRASLTDLPLEADPADVAEQDAVVPYDDER